MYCIVVQILTLLFGLSFFPPPRFLTELQCNSSCVYFFFKKKIYEKKNPNLLLWEGYSRDRAPINIFFFQNFVY
jgi:hypothetical protein